MKFICSLIVVENIEKSRYFYEKLLGQKVVSDFGENVAFEGGFAIHQKAHFSKLICNLPIGKKTNNFELYFEDDAIEEIVKILHANGIEFIHEIMEQPWKQRVTRFYDYDFNAIEIGERMEHVAYRLHMENYSIDEICKITYLSEEKVRSSVEEYFKK
jgi:catechol 2,3-dioxygenase-like lactoylglutathione lyase family enzyme